jgi:uncharacterized protein (DUF433 family)
MFVLHPKPTFIASFDEARRNIMRYQTELLSSPALQDRIRKVRSWYVEQDAEGNWLFAPSKFTGYRSLSAAQYLQESGGSGLRDGRDTEHVLKKWYEVVDPNTRLGRELLTALREFLATMGRVPNKLARLNRPKGGWEAKGVTIPGSSADRENLFPRISVDPEICGGRPCIKGTRMRVVDIVEAIASGATAEEILQDFDYLTKEDIAAALLYAARAADHRVIRTA